MENYMLLYKIRVTDEFGRYFESNAKLNANTLIIKEQADALYLHVMGHLISDILLRMGTDTNAEWSVEVNEELTV